MRKLLTIVFCFCLLVGVSAQEQGIQTENTLSAEDLVKDVFIKGNCRNVSNITVLGDENLSIGQFKNGTSTVSLADGILLTTGLLDLAVGPNVEIDASYAFDLISEDADLRANRRPTSCTT